jgi:hypothetical protein
MARPRCDVECVHSLVLFAAYTDPITIRNFIDAPLKDCEMLKTACPMYYPDSWAPWADAFPLVHLLHAHDTSKSGVPALIEAGFNLLDLDPLTGEFRILVSAVVKYANKMLMRLIIDAVAAAARAGIHIPINYFQSDTEPYARPTHKDIKFLWWCWQELHQAGMKRLPVDLTGRSVDQCMSLPYYQECVNMGIPLPLLLVHSAEYLPFQEPEMQALARQELVQVLGVRRTLTEFGQSRRMRGPSRATNFFQVNSLMDLITSYCFTDNEHVQNAARSMQRIWDESLAKRDKFVNSRPKRRKRFRCQRGTPLP